MPTLAELWPHRNVSRPLVERDFAVITGIGYTGGEPDATMVVFHDRQTAMRTTCLSIERRGTENSYRDQSQSGCSRGASNRRKASRSFGGS